MEFKKIAFSATESSAIADRGDSAVRTISSIPAQKSFDLSKITTKTKDILSVFPLLGSKTKDFAIYLSQGIKRVLSFRKNKTEASVDAGDDQNTFRRHSKDPKKIKKALYLIIALVIMVSGYVLIRNNGSIFQNGSVAGDKTEVKAPQKTTDVNKDFFFPLKDADGEELSKIKYTIEKAELRDEIIVKGQKATAVEGRTFLIVYLKITNEYTQNLEISSRDYVRLSINGNEDEWLAPDIHNDPVEVQAQSTKVTRLGFPINVSDTKLVLRVGEINGDKERVELSF